MLKLLYLYFCPIFCDNFQIFVDLGPPKAQSVIISLKFLDAVGPSKVSVFVLFGILLHFQISMQIAMQPFCHHSL